MKQDGLTVPPPKGIYRYANANELH